MSSLGTFEDLVEFSEIRLTLLCECLRHFETFGCFTGLPDRCRVALHFVVCEERDLPWNDASGVPLVVSKAKDVREWCLESLASLLHTTFSMLATSSLVAKMTAKATYDDVFNVEGDPNALFSSQFLAAASKYGTGRASHLLSLRPATFDPENSILRMDKYSARAVSGVVLQSLLDNPFTNFASNRSQTPWTAASKERFLLNAVEKLCNAIISQVERDLLSQHNGNDENPREIDDENILPNSDNQQQKQQQQGKNEKNVDEQKSSSSSSKSFISISQIFADDEVCQQLVAILRAGAEFVTNELFPLLVTSTTLDLAGATISDAQLKSCCFSHDQESEEIVSKIVHEETNSLGNTNYNSNGGKLRASEALHSTCDNFGNFLSCTYSDEQDDDDEVENDDDDDEVDPTSRFACYLPHLKDLGSLFNLQRIFCSSKNKNKTATQTTTAATISNNFCQAAIPASIVAPLAVLLDLSSRINQLYVEIVSSVSPSSSSSSLLDSFVQSILCPISAAHAAPFIQNRFVNPFGFVKSAENQALESLKLFIHEELKNKIFFFFSAKSPVPALACLSLVPKLVVDLLFVAGRAALFSTSARSFSLVKKNIQISNMSIPTTQRLNDPFKTPMQTHRLFSSCVKKVQEKMRGTFLAKIADSFVKLEEEHNECGGSDKEDSIPVAPVNRARVLRCVKSRFVFDEDNDEAFYFLARSSSSDKILLTLWE